MRLERCCSFGPAAVCRLTADTPGSTTLEPNSMQYRAYTFPWGPLLQQSVNDRAARKVHRRHQALCERGEGRRSCSGADAICALIVPATAPYHSAPITLSIRAFRTSKIASSLRVALEHLCHIEVRPHRKTEMAMTQAANDNQPGEKPEHATEIALKGAIDQFRAGGRCKMALRATRIGARH